MVSESPALALVLVEELEEVAGVSVELTTSGRLEIEKCGCDVVVVFESIVDPQMLVVKPTVVDDVKAGDVRLR